MKVYQEIMILNHLIIENSNRNPSKSS